MSNRSSNHSSVGRTTIRWGILAGIAIPVLFIGAWQFPSYYRRSELHRRVFRGHIELTFSPLQYRTSYFHTRHVLPQWVSDKIGEEWVRPLEPLTRALFASDSDDDVQRLSPEVELQHVCIVAEEGKCSDKLLRHLIHLPALRGLAICNVPLTGDGIELLSRMQNLQSLHVECSTEPSRGLEQLSRLSQIQELSLIDERQPISDEVYHQIARLPSLRIVRLGTSMPSEAGFAALTRSTTIEHISFAYPKRKLTLEWARQLARMKAIKSVGFGHEVEPEAQVFLKDAGLVEEEIELIGLPLTAHPEKARELMSVAASKSASRVE